MEGCIESRKRVRDESTDSFSDVLESKIVRADSIELDFISPDENAKSEQSGIHADDSVTDSFQANAIEQHLLKILDEADSTDRDSAIQDLDSVIRSFEKEIHVPEGTVEPAVEIVSQPELGFLLEASDDELGLPPTAISSEKGKIEAVEFSTHYASSSSTKEFLGLEEEVPSNCWFDSLSSENDSNGGEDVVALGGLFDHTDVAVEFPCRSETMFCL